MSAQNRTQDKAGPQDGLENKSLTEATEVKSVDPGVKIEFVGHVSAGYIDGKEHGPGDKPMTVHPQVAHDLVVAGVAKRAD